MLASPTNFLLLLFLLLAVASKPDHRVVLLWRQCIICVWGVMDMHINVDGTQLSTVIGFGRSPGYTDTKIAQPDYNSIEISSFCRALS